MADKVAKDFTEFWTEFHSYNQPYDDLMDAELHEQYAKVLREQSKWGYFDFKSRPLFGPSSAGDSELELYHRTIKSKKDPQSWTPNQRDWTGLGTQVGDYIQREILLAERHYKKLTGKEPRFKFERTERGEPAFEHFKKVMHEIEYDGEKFALFGLPDGILEYTTDDGEVLRVGLEVKSFQKYQSEFKKLKEPKYSHAVQTTSYSEMYGLDLYLIVYFMTTGVDWFKEDVERIKVFGKAISEADRTKLKDKLAGVVKSAREGKAPALNLDSWQFNNYKRAIAESLSEAEVVELENQVRRYMKSRLPEWKKQKYYDALEFIKEVRG